MAIKLLKNTTSFFLILILLVSSLQFSIYKMECLISGNVTVSLQNLEDCDTEEEESCTVSNQCCSFHQVDLNFDYASIHHHTPINTFSLLPLLIPSSILSHHETVTITYSHFDVPPPITSGKELIQAIQVFRI